MFKKKKKEKVEKLELEEVVTKLDPKDKKKKEKKVKEKRVKEKKKIDFKKIFKSIFSFIMSHKIFTLINILFIVLIVLAFFRKVLFGLFVIILWLVFIILYRIIGGKIAKEKKAIKIDAVKLIIIATANDQVSLNLKRKKKK